jgi:hypothetical protein
MELIFLLPAGALPFVTFVLLDKVKAANAAVYYSFCPVSLFVPQWEVFNPVGLFPLYNHALS